MDDGGKNRKKWKANIPDRRRRGTLDKILNRTWAHKKMKKKKMFVKIEGFKTQFTGNSGRIEFATSARFKMS